MGIFCKSEKNRTTVLFLELLMLRTLSVSLSSIALAVSALASSAAVQAQTQVELYGLIDVGVTHVSGLRGGSVTQLTSGTMEGSRWGIRGSEDLGGGWRALFVMESRLEADTGSLSNRPVSGQQLPDVQSQATLMGLPAGAQGTVTAVANGLADANFGVNINNARAFDRQIYLGLVTPVGAVLGGRMYTPGFEVDVEYDIFRTEGIVNAGTTTPFLPAVQNRISNALQYRIQTESIVASVMYGFREDKTSVANASLVGAQVRYTTGGLSLGLGFNRAKDNSGRDALESRVLGASYRVGAHKVAASWVNFENKNPIPAGAINSAVPAQIQNAFSEAFRQDGQRFHLGYQFTTGPHTFRVAYNRFDDDRPNNADVTTYGAGYNYAFSPRTDFYTQIARVSNSANAQVALGGNGYLGGVTRAGGVDSTAMAVGIRHRF